MWFWEYTVACSAVTSFWSWVMRAALSLILFPMRRWTRALDEGGDGVRVGESSAQEWAPLVSPLYCVELAEI
jgi:hypothetical protein